MHKRNSSSGTQLNCFSPPVMLATFTAEICMAGYVLWCYRLNNIGRLAVSMLAFLGLFQLSEYFVCGGAGMSSESWSRTGYAAITMLPPLGLHLMCVLAGKRRRWLLAAAYASAAGFIAYFLLYHAAFKGYQCTGNYVIFQLGMHPAIAYGAYYYGWIVATLGLGLYWAGQVKTRGKKVLLQVRTIYALIAGYLIFLLPTALANSVKPETRRGIPSIMCGFAILFALILTFYILPRIGKKRQLT